MVAFKNCFTGAGLFGTCTKDWNYTVRLYRPRPDILNGKWKFPEPELVGRLNKKSDYERIDRKY
jgi:hypothetical protein